MDERGSFGVGVEEDVRVSVYEAGEYEGIVPETYVGGPRSGGRHLGGGRGL